MTNSTRILRNSSNSVHVSGAPSEITREQGREIVQRLQSLGGFQGSYAEAYAKLQALEAPANVSDTTRLNSAEQTLRATSADNARYMAQAQAANAPEQPTQDPGQQNPGIRGYQVPGQPQPDQSSLQRSGQNVSDFFQAETGDGKNNATGFLGEATRGLALPTGGAVLGAVVGAGAATGMAWASATAFVTDMIINTINHAAGTDYPTTKQAINRIMDNLGVADGDTVSEELLGLATEASIGARSIAELARIAREKYISNPLVHNMATKILDVFSANPNQQAIEEIGGTYGAAAGDKIAQDNEMGPWGQALLGTAGGILGGVVGSGIGEVSTGLDNIISTQAATTPRGPGKGFSPYTASELAGRPRAQGGDFPTQAATSWRNLFEDAPNGTGEYHFRRYNENIQALEGVLIWRGIQLNGFNAAPDFSRGLIDDFTTARSARLTEHVGAKNDILARMDEATRIEVPATPTRQSNRNGAAPAAPTVTNTTVPTTSAQEYLSEQFAYMMKINTPEAERLVKTIESWRNSINGNSFSVLESTREMIGRQLDLPNNADIRTTGTRIFNNAYEKLTDDMGVFVEDTLGPDARDLWQSSNSELSSMGKDFSDRALTQIMEEWDKGASNIQSEVITDLLASTKLSDAQKLFRNLSGEGQEIARNALISMFATTTNTGDLSPELFARNLQRYGKTIGIYFEPDYTEYLEGLYQHFYISRRSEPYVRAFGQIQGPPLSAMPGTGTGISMMVRQHPLMMFLTVATVGNLGKMGRIMEQMPQIKTMLRELATLDPNGVPAQNLSRIIAQATSDAYNDMVDSEPDDQAGQWHYPYPGQQNPATRMYQDPGQQNPATRTYQVPGQPQNPALRTYQVPGQPQNPATRTQQVPVRPQLR